MKQLKFIIVFIVLLLSFSSNDAHYNYTAGAGNSFNQDTCSTTEPLDLISSPNVMSKDLAIHFIFKKKSKYRATTTDSSILKTPYFKQLIKFKIYKSSLIYGIAVIYQIQRHTHLHLYQLF